MYNYYNKLLYEKACALIKSDPIGAKESFEEYFEQYPNDYNAYSKYIYVLIILNEAESAEKVLKYIDLVSGSNDKFLNCERKVRRLRNDNILNKIRLLGLQEKYQELYDYIQDNYNYLDIENLDKIIIFCQKKLNILPKKRNGNSYSVRQIIDYQEKDFINHIKKHQVEFNDSEKEPNKSIFCASFPILKVVEEVKKYIPSDKKLCKNPISDTYIFRYDDCGRDNNKIVNFFKVICFHNTLDLITMCPSCDCENLPYVDLNYLNLEENKSKVKVLTQIEKFNRRFRQSKVN